MSSMTAILTPAQGGAVSVRLSVPTPSYWDTLKEFDRLASINAHKFRKLGRKTGWFPAGVVLKKWTEEIYPNIARIINDAGNYERIVGKHNKEVNQPCQLYMVGEGQQWMTARPTIVAICSKTRIAKRICELLQEISCMKTWNLGFDYMHHREKLELVTGEGDLSTSSSLLNNLCGLQVLASTYPASLNAKWKQTTAGGTLKINNEYYCLSVAHAFHLDASIVGGGGSDSSLDSDDSSGESDDSNSALDPKSSVSVIACRPDMLEHVDLGLYLDYGPISTSARALGGDSERASINADSIRVIGSGRVTPATTPGVQSLLVCAELDWALIRVNDPQFFRPNLVQAPSGMMLAPQRVSVTPPHGKVLVAAGVSGVFESSCQGIVGGLSLPGSFQMVDVWTIESMCLPGDSGSWVIDPITGSIYGMIIATAPEAQESYMIPAYLVYESINSRLPRGTTIEFPTYNDNDIARAKCPSESPADSIELSMETVSKSETDSLQSQAISEMRLPDIGDTKGKVAGQTPEYRFVDRASFEQAEMRHTFQDLNKEMDDLFLEEKLLTREGKPISTEVTQTKDKSKLTPEEKEAHYEATRERTTGDYQGHTTNETDSRNAPVAPSPPASFFRANEGHISASTVANRCQHCGYESKFSTSMLVFEEDPHCRHCGISAFESDSKMQEDLSDLMARNIYLSNTVVQPSFPAATPPSPRLEPQPAPITYIAQHYRHSSYHEPVMTKINIEPSQILAAAGIDASVLFPSQLQLFKHAAPDQQLRLIELWKIAPPTYGQQMLAKDLGNWPQTNLAQEEEAARHRWEILSKHEREHNINAQQVRSNAEPYIVDGYEKLPNINEVTAPTEFRPKGRSGEVGRIQQGT